MTLHQLNARLDELLEFKAGMFAGRSPNPLFGPTARDRKGLTWRIGAGKEKSVLISKISSPQRDIQPAKVRSMTGKMKRGTFKSDALPTLQHAGGGHYSILDGNHRAVSAMKAGKLKVRAMVY